MGCNPHLNWRLNVSQQNSNSNGKAIRDGHRIATAFEPGRHWATEVIELPSSTQARRYVREKGLQVVRGKFKMAPNASVYRAECKLKGDGSEAQE